MSKGKDKEREKIKSTDTLVQRGLRHGGDLAVGRLKGAEANFFFTPVEWLRQGLFIREEKHSKLLTSFYPFRNPSLMQNNTAQFQ